MRFKINKGRSSVFILFVIIIIFPSGPSHKCPVFVFDQLSKIEFGDFFPSEIRHVFGLMLVSNDV